MADTRMQLVVVFDPEAASGAVHRSLTQVRRIGREGLFDGEDVLPGFSCRITEILEHHGPLGARTATAARS